MYYEAAVRLLSHSAQAVVEPRPDLLTLALLRYLWLKFLKQTKHLT